jgi:hypothetical protein
MLDLNLPRKECESDCLESDQRLSAK